MRSNIFTAFVVLAAASGSSMVTGAPIPRGLDLSTRFAFEVPDSSRFGMDFVKRSPANGGNGRSSDTGNVNAGDVVNSGDNIQNGPGANTALNGGTTASGNAEGGGGSNGGRGGSATSGSSGAARGGSVRNNGGSITNTGTATNPSNRAGNGGTSSTGNARGGNAGSRKRSASASNFDSKPEIPELPVTLPVSPPAVPQPIQAPSELPVPAPQVPSELPAPSGLPVAVPSVVSQVPSAPLDTIRNGTTTMGVPGQANGSTVIDTVTPAADKVAQTITNTVPA